MGVAAAMEDLPLQYVINLGLALLPFVIVIIVCLVLRKVLSRLLGETHQVNSYILVFIPFMCVLIGGYIVCRPLLMGERSVTVLPDVLNISAKSYTIDESWRKNGLSSFKVGDLVVYRAGTKDAFNKQSTIPMLHCARVIGLPGNHLVSKMAAGSTGGNRFYLEIDGQRAEGALSATNFSGINDLRYGLRVPEGSLWVMIDYGARKGVQDFDSPYVGPVRVAQIVGTIQAWGNTDFTDLVDDTKKK